MIRNYATVTVQFISPLTGGIYRKLLHETIALFKLVIFNILKFCEGC